MEEILKFYFGFNKKQAKEYIKKATPEATEGNVVMYLKNYTTVLSTDDGGYMVELW